MRGITLAIAAALLASGTAHGFQVPEYVASNVRTRVLNGWSVGIVVGIVDSTGSHYQAYGRTVRGGQPVDEHTVFEIGSITKVFTALLLADMALKGEVGLDDAVQRHLPDPVRAPRLDSLDMTLRLLSAHRSGLPRQPSNFAPANPANPFADYDSTRLFAFLSGHTLSRAPGAQYEYSNVGAGLLGFVLARRAGTSYEAVVRQRILDPLGLGDTRISLTSELRARLAGGHAGEREVPNWDFDALAGAGALRSTAADMARFLSFAMGLARTPLNPALRLTQQIQAEAVANMRVGLGWHVIGPDSVASWWHDGGTGGYRAFIGYDPRKSRGVVVLSNSNESVNDIGFHLLNPALPLGIALPVVALPAESLDAYVGEYELAPDRVLSVRKVGRYLVMQLTGQAAVLLYPSGPGEFFARPVDARITFRREAGGRAESLVLRERGRDTPGRRR